MDDAEPDHPGARHGRTHDARAPSEPVEHRSDPPALDRALDLVRFLRRNCPWDARQTAESLVPHLLEETHEVVDAIQRGDAAALEGELGDLLLNLAFQIVVAEEEERLSADSVARALEGKMRRRHPHLYGQGETAEWEALKARERPPGEGILDGLSPGLDALTRAHRMQERVAAVGFDWPDADGARKKVEEELGEVDEARLEGDADQLEEELGDLLFAVVNLVRLAGAHATVSLARANRKFRARFERLEALADARGVRLGEVGLETLDRLWDEVKEMEPSRSVSSRPQDRRR